MLPVVIAMAIRRGAAAPCVVLMLLTGACGGATTSGTTGPVAASPSEAPSTSPAVPSALSVTCDVDGVRVSTDVVAASPEGVAVHFERADEDDGEQWGIAWHADAAGAGDNMPGGLVHLPIPPGPGAQVSCTPLSAGYATESDDARSRWTAQIEVIDPDGHWVDDRLDCENAFGFSALGTTTPSPVPIAEAPEAVAEVLGEYEVQPSEIRAAGYTSGDAPPFVVVRDDRVLARVPTHPSREGRVIVGSSADMCESLR